MKLVKIAMLVIVLFFVLSFIREGEGFHPGRVLPFAGGDKRTGIYDWAGVILIVITCWGLSRLNRRNGED